MTNPVDRLQAALTVLAGHGHVKQRLMKAYEEHLVEVDDDELPVAMKQSFADLRALMHQVTPLKGESPVCASVRKMSLEEASECAAQVVALYGEISRLRDEVEVSLPLGDDKPARVPPFLVKTN
jgi:hypothetical protein